MRKEAATNGPQEGSKEKNRVTLHQIILNMKGAVKYLTRIERTMRVETPETNEDQVSSGPEISDAAEDKADQI